METIQAIFTLSEVADLLRVTKETVRREIKRGNLKAAKVGYHWRITRLDLNSYLRSTGSAGLEQARG